MGDNNPTEGDTNKTTVPDTAAAATTSPTATAAPSEPVGERKIDIFFKNTGNAPVIRDNKTKWKVKPSTKLSEISNLLVKILKLDTSQSIFIYVNQSFAPSLDQTIQNLYDCYECDKSASQLSWTTTRSAMESGVVDSEMNVAGEEPKPDLKDVVVVLDKWTRICDMVLSSIEEQISKISKTSAKS